MRIKPKRPIFKLFLVNAAILFLLLALIEGAWLVLLRWPWALVRMPAGIKYNVKSQYMGYDRSIVQMEPACAMYDRELTYRLRPGSCPFSNYEFSVTVDVNTMGLRDDEDSLAAPEVIVLGDSIAMGWGVEGRETFADVIEKKSGLKVLNAAISSYGTMREALMLNRLDTSALRYLVIQHSDNDFEENVSFFKKTRPTKAQYDANCRDHGKQRQYVFGLHIVRFVRGLLKLANPTHDMVTSATKGRGGAMEAEAFLNALTRARKELRGVRVIVVELNAENLNDSEFTDALKAAIAKGGLPAHIDDMKVLDVSGVLDDGDYFTLDDHMNARGHAKVAERLLKEITP